MTISLAERTDRGVFERVRKHLLDQMTQSADEREYCYYRMTTEAGDELRCSIGCLIEDDLYRPELEDQPIKEFAVLGTVIASLGFAPSLWLLQDLQNLHDTVQPEEWEDRMTEFHFSDAGEYVGGFRRIYR